MVLCSVWRCRPRLCRAPVPLIGPGEGKISKSTLRGTQWDSTPYSIPQRPHTGRGSVLVVAAVFVESLPGPGVDLREAQPGLLLTAEREDVLRNRAGTETQKSVSLSLSLSLYISNKTNTPHLLFCHPTLVTVTLAVYRCLEQKNIKQILLRSNSLTSSS